MKFNILLVDSKEWIDDDHCRWEQTYDIRDADDNRLTKLAEYYRKNPKEYRNVRLFTAEEIKGA